MEQLLRLHEAMYNYKSNQEVPYDPAKLAIHSILRLEVDRISNSGHIFKKTVSFEDLVPSIDEENIVTYVDFDFSLTFYPEART